MPWLKQWEQQPVGVLSLLVLLLLSQWCQQEEQKFKGKEYNTKAASLLALLAITAFVTQRHNHFLATYIHICVPLVIFGIYFDPCLIMRSSLLVTFLLQVSYNEKRNLAEPPRKVKNQFCSKLHFDWSAKVQSQKQLNIQ